jgi:hypothetical protein
MKPEDVCLFDGAGYLQCWSCPATHCPFYKGTEDRDLTEDVAIKAVEKLFSNEIVVEGLGGRHIVDSFTDKAEAAKVLADSMLLPEVQERLRTWMAAEAVSQGLMDGRIQARIDQLWQSHARWLRKINRPLSSGEEAQFQARLDAVSAQVAQEVYQGIDKPMLKVAINHLSGLVKKATPEARERARARRK